MIGVGMVRRIAEVPKAAYGLTVLLVPAVNLTISPSNASSSCPQFTCPSVGNTSVALMRSWRWTGSRGGGWSRRIADKSFRDSWLSRRPSALRIVSFRGITRRLASNLFSHYQHPSELQLKFYQRSMVRPNPAEGLLSRCPERKNGNVDLQLSLCGSTGVTFPATQEVVVECGETFPGWSVS